MSVRYTEAMSDEEQIGEYITLARAAEIAGYSGSSNLRHASAAGTLRTRMVGKIRFTTQEWLDAYLATLHPGNYKRGHPRKGLDAGGEAGE